jgi:hypothetical protein
MGVSKEWREKWKEKITESQKITYYLLEDKPLPRIKYGEEAHDWGQMTILAVIAEWKKANSTFRAAT